MPEDPRKDRIRFYRGWSMAGTFRPGDLLILEPAKVEDVRPGDVIVFRGPAALAEAEGPEAARELVHRVVASGPCGLVTRGDGNPEADAEPVTGETLTGRVVFLVRGGVTRPVRGGARGLARARLLRVRAGLLGGLKLVGRRPYGWLRASGLAAKLWRPPLKRISFTTDQGPQVKYVHGGRTVAVWWPERGRFECVKPYDLLFRNDGREPEPLYPLES